MSRGDRHEQIPPGAVRQHWSLLILAVFCLAAGVFMAALGVVELLPSEEIETLEMPVGAAIATIVVGGALLAVAIWAWRYYRFNYIAVTPTEIVQRTAANTVRRIPYRDIKRVEEFKVHHSRQVRITAKDGTTITADSEGLDILEIRKRAGGPLR